MKRGRRLTFLATFAVFALAATPALAAERYVRTGHFTAQEAPHGPFGKPRGVAVDEATGDVYVTDSLRGVVERFGAEGKYVSELTGTPTGPEGATAPFSQPGAVTVDNYPGPSLGDLYVADSVRRTTAGGEPGERIPVIDQFTPAGVFLDQISGETGAGGPSPFFAATISSLAVGPDHDLWVTDLGGTVQNRGTHNGGEGSQIDVLEESTEPGEPWKLATTTGAGGPPIGIAIDPADEHLYAVTKTGVGFNLRLERWTLDPEHNVAGTPTVIVPKSGSVVAAGALTADVLTEECSIVSSEEAICSVAKFGPLGAPPQEKFGAQLDSQGLALNDATGAIYATDSFGEVVIFKKVHPGPPTAATTPARNVGEFGATITGRVNPQARPTTYAFQYSTTSTVACPAHPSEPSATCTSLPANPLGENAETLPVSAALEDLTPGATYHYRVLAENADGTVYGEDQSFEAEPYPSPTVTTGEAESIAQTRVTLAGSVDPHEQDTSYQFEIGATNGYGTTVSAINLTGSGPQPVRLILANLVPGTTYHYRITATNRGGLGAGEDRTFTTAAPLFAPAVFTTTPTEPIEEPKRPPSKPLSKPLTKAEKLTKALKACRAKRNRHQRSLCEKQARRKYGPAKKATK
jgi:hypothetical protein